LEKEHQQKEEKERQEKEERERQEWEEQESQKELEIHFEKAQAGEVTAQMKSFGIEPGQSYDISDTGYMKGPGWLEPTFEDMLIADNLAYKLNSNEVLKENFRKQLRTVKSQDRWFVVGLSSKTGAAHVFGLRDPRYVDPSTGEPINPAEVQGAPE